MSKSQQILLALLMLSSTSLLAQKTSVWKSLSFEEISNLSKVLATHKNTEGERYYTLNTVALKQIISSASSVHANTKGVIVSIPNFKGEIEQFEVWENSNFDPVLQAKYPDIRAYTGKGITDKSATINFSLAPIGIQTAVFRIGKEAEFIEAYDRSASVYVSFNSKNSHAEHRAFKCGVDENEHSIKSTPNTNKSSAGQLKTMRLAASCNGEYAQHFGGTLAGALGGINASLTRMNALFERDLAIHLNLIANNDTLLYLDPATDPFSDGSIGASNDVWNLETQNNLSALIGNDGYDLGHLFCKTGGGGNAGCIGCVCVDDDIADQTDKNKGAGFTSPDSDTAPPEGDIFDYDFLAHEFGHQFGANHSFSYSFEDSGVQVEPGSGCATMGYAGVTGPYDVQPHNIIQFTTASIEQIQANMATKTCPVDFASSETPFVSAGADYTIPKGTAFVLSGTGSDADTSDVLSYSWEQNDSGTDGTAAENCITTDTKTEGPTFRLYTATSSPIRYFPKLEYVLLGELTTPSNWESVSNVERDLNFTLTARDNHPGAGQTRSDSMTVSVVTTAGPFVVTSQDTAGIVLNGGSTEAVTWDVAGTTANGVNCANVMISLSTDGGFTYPTILVASTENDGSQAITLPNTPSTTARIKIEGVGNIFYDISNADFTIEEVFDTDGDGFFTNEDCDDTNANSYPGASEICDGQDNDCDTSIPADELDGDSDGLSACAGDCDDAAATIYTGAPELCDGLDNNCDNLVPANELDADADGLSACAGDCDDTSAAANPSATEVCDGTDNNCDGTTDEGLTSAYYADADGDGFGNTAVSMVSCAPVAGFVTINGDCDDTSAAANPSATEVCDGTDNNCDGTTDEGLTSTFYADADGDGFGNAAASVVACSATTGFVANGTDCNDANAAANPSATEVCDGTDNNCDGTTDEGLTSTFYADADGDGFGNAAASVVACSATTGFVANSTDCNDANAAINPSAAEVCDGLDNNCDNNIPLNEQDSDGDNAFACGGDCNDTDATVLPNAPELCDGQDNNCDGVMPTDEEDADHDNVMACDGDCDDTNAGIYPGATEIANNGIDEDCDGEDLISGVNEPSLEQLLTVTPNPFSTSLNLRCDCNASLHYTLYDQLGRALKLGSAQINHGSVEIKTPGLTPGMYYLSITDEAGKSFFVKRLVNN